MCHPRLMPRMTHLTDAGDAHMVDVGGKAATARRAEATACVRTTPAVIESIASGGVAKGDVLAVARVAGILAAKQTAQLIPLCHPVQTTSAVVEFEPDAARGEAPRAGDDRGVRPHGRGDGSDRSRQSVASLTVYDMIKSVDRWATIDAVRLETKSGGKSGPVTRPGGRIVPTLRRPRLARELVALRDEARAVDEAIARA